jgi:hypothetical protein
MAASSGRDDRRAMMFVARDKNDDLYLFDELPRRGNE